MFKGKKIAGMSVFSVLGAVLFASIIVAAGAGIVWSFVLTKEKSPADVNLVAGTDEWSDADFYSVGEHYHVECVANYNFNGATGIHYYIGIIAGGSGPIDTGDFTVTLSVNGEPNVLTYHAIPDDDGNGTSYAWISTQMVITSETATDNIQVTITPLADSLHLHDVSFGIVAVDSIPEDL